MRDAYFQSDGLTLYQGHVLDVLRELYEAGRRFQTICTSPPYLGLRAYGTNPLIWQGDLPLCEGEHVWDTHVRRVNGGHTAGRRQSNFHETVEGRQRRIERSGGGKKVQSDFCAMCGAWRGELGAEPTPELYVQHITQIARAAGQVLRPDGLFFLNLGTSYWGGKGQSGQKGDAHQEGRHVRGESLNRGYQTTGGKGVTRATDAKHSRFKAKDLVPIPQMVADALQADGWIRRSDIPWQKSNVMPGSQDDRPTLSHEYVMMFAKSNQAQFWTHRDRAGTRTAPKPDYCYRDELTGEEFKSAPQGWKDAKLPDGKKRYSRFNLWRGHDYFYDVDAVRIAPAPASLERAQYKMGFFPKGEDADKAHVNYINNNTIEASRAKIASGLGRQLRTKDFSDWSLEALIDSQREYLEHLEAVKSNGGLLTTPDGDPAVLYVNTSSFKGAHFATWPIKLVEPLLKISTSAFGCCAKCGAPYTRRVSEVKVKIDDGGRTIANVNGVSESSIFRTGMQPVRETLGWQPTCDCLSDTCPHKNGNGVTSTKRSYNTKHTPGATGLPQQGIYRDHTVEQGRDASREEAKQLYPDDPRAQQDYINWVHDHGGIKPRETVGWEATCDCLRESDPPDPRVGTKYQATGNGVDGGGKRRHPNKRRELDQSRKDAKALFPDDPRAQQDYINHVHDHSGIPHRETVGWEATCGCAADVEPCEALELFGGSGTTQIAAWQLGLRCTAIELKPDYCDIAIKRFQDEKAEAEKERAKRERKTVVRSAQARDEGRGVIVKRQKTVTQLALLG